MTVKANGAPLEWAGYQYARIYRGLIVEIGELETLRANLGTRKLPGKIMFRAAYVSAWMEVTDDGNP